MFSLWQKVEELGTKPVQLTLEDYYVQVVIESSPDTNLASLARNLKRITASALKEEFPALKSKMSSIWDGQVLINSGDTEIPTEDLQEFLSGVRTRYEKN